MKDQKITLETINRINCAGADALEAVLNPHVGDKVACHLVNKLVEEYAGDVLSWLNSLTDNNYMIVVEAFNY